MSIEGVGEEIRILMAKHRIKVRDVAEALGKSAGTIQTYMSPNNFAERQAEILKCVKKLLK